MPYPPEGSTCQGDNALVRRAEQGKDVNGRRRWRSVAPHRRPMGGRSQCPSAALRTIRCVVVFHIIWCMVLVICCLIIAAVVPNWAKSRSVDPTFGLGFRALFGELCIQCMLKQGCTVSVCMFSEMLYACRVSRTIAKRGPDTQARLPCLARRRCQKDSFTCVSLLFRSQRNCPFSTARVHR